MRFDEIVFILIAGFLLDLVFGDPEAILHPVVLIGRLIHKAEGWIRQRFPQTEAGERAGGVLLALFVPAVSFLVPWFALKLAGLIHPYARIALSVFWCWQIFAARTLAKEARMVGEKVQAGDLAAARLQVGRIVGRDTAGLSMTEVIKACIETVAESASDGVIAPLLFIAIGGVPLGFLYKAINTLDSMVGYKNDRYRYFGTASARLDDVANFIPARLTALLMILTAPLVGLDGRNAFRMWKRDRLKHLSPNSGNPESACAGALNVQLGGDAFYFGKLYKKNTLGDPNREVEAEDIPKAVRLMYAASWAALILAAFIRIIL
ncbi:MAG: cobalamin biosynthesis protein CobD [Firmicutes bacterium]|nr:cobalamin biosynthesis protein CobD [Bacillota bacterium]